MISEYNNIQKYYLGRLDKVVYLIDEDALKSITIDNGAAYVEISGSPMSIAVSDIALTDDSELDERYRFTHTLTFTVNGYANYKDFEGNYYAIVKTLDGVYWLVNPLFPCKVTYTYTLDSIGNRTDFTLSTMSNHPTLMVDGMSNSTPYTCDYKYCTIKSIKINENANSLKLNNQVLYTNDGFKTVNYNKDSAVFTEQFDGINIQHSLGFDIRFDDYKSSWHYNLLEFVDNKYAVIVGTTCGNTVLCGFGFGLQPSFTVEANDDAVADKIHIDLTDLHDNGLFIGYESGVTISKDDAKSWIYTKKYSGYECNGNGTARYLLKEEVDAFGNSTGRYMCLVGYESSFSNLNIVGTFTTTDTFTTYECSNQCKLQSSFPPEFIFNAATCKSYQLISDSDWSISSTSNNITVAPTYGEANVPCTVRICNTVAPTSTEAVSQINLSYCNKSVTYNVRVKQGDGCLPMGNVYDISANGQFVTVPTSCCISEVVDVNGVLTNITIQDTYFNVYVPQNNSTSRQFILSITYCDNSTGEVIINQGTCFENWVTEGTVCNGTQKCDVQRRYTGTTNTSINTYTNETRAVNCSASTDCQDIITRWIDTSATTCVGESLHKVTKEQISYDGGTTWTDTGTEGIGDQIEDTSGQCASITYEYQWILTTATTCVGYNKYYLYKRQRRISGSSDAWVDVIPTQTAANGDGLTPVIAEANSTDCGYVPPVEPTYKWETMDIDTDWVCTDCGSQASLKIAYRTTAEGATVVTAACDSNTTLSASNYNNSDIEYVMVGGCITYIGDDCFSGKTNLTEVLLPINIQTIGANAFKGCTSLSDIALPPLVSTIGNYAFSGCTSLNKITLGSIVDTIGNEAFAYCDNLNTVNIPDDIQAIPYRCFYNCSGLTDIYLSSNITSIGNEAFYGCSNLVNVICAATVPPTISQFTFGAVPTDFTIYVPQASLTAYQNSQWGDSYYNHIVGY